jgi:acetyl esterase/lipase
MASPQLQVIVQAFRDRPVDKSRTIEQSRADMEQLLQIFPVPADVRVEAVSAGAVPGAWVSVPNSVEEKVLYFLHGGGYATGSIKTHTEMVSRICRAAGLRGLLIEYRLAPEHSFPAAVEDAATAYRWLLGQGISPEDIVIAGDSAGGGLTLATLANLRDCADSLPAAAVCLSPWTDMEAIGESVQTNAAVDPLIDREELLRLAGLYLAGADPRTPLAAPLYADPKGMPPLLIQVGRAEVLMDDSIRFAERAKAAGVDVTLEVWDEMIHVWQIMAALLPEGQQAIERIGAFIRERLGLAIPAPTQPR